MPRQRPHFNKSISELEKLFTEFVDNRTELKILEHEVLPENRRMPRAAVLLKKVRERLSELASGQSAPKQGSLFPSPKLTPPAPSSDKPSRAQTLSVPVSTIVKPSSPKLTPAHSIKAKIEIPHYLASAVEVATPQPKKDNDPSSILSSWLATEALSPQTYKRPENLASDDRRLVVSLSDVLPWLEGAKSKPSHQLFYEVVLGAINMDEASSQLVAAFGVNEERERPNNLKAATATFIIDAKGIPLEEEGIGVSSFAWALPKALRKELSSLNKWPEVELKAIEGLRQIIHRLDDDGDSVPVDTDVIEAAHQWLVRSFALADDLVEAPRFAIRRYHHFKTKGLPEPQLLNSFFLNDLTRAIDLVSVGKWPNALESYLGITKPDAPVDLLKNLKALEASVSPAQIPVARWPMGPDRSLVLLQQAAINLSRVELEANGIFAVNGPPGTGKTTLLRDVVADVVVQRARAMVAFSKPDEAFRSSGEKVRTGPTFRTLYKLDPSLRGFEILVASSNNKAVENISKELPGIGALGRSEPRYFKSVSERVLNPVSNFDEPHTMVKNQIRAPLETWGLIAAVMGNRKNISSFQNSFWWDKDYSMRLYLRAAKGDDIREEIKDHETGKLTGYRTPKIMSAEKPPAGNEAAQAAWRSASARFKKLEKQVSDIIKERDAVRRTFLASFDEREKLRSIRIRIAEAEASAQVLGVANIKAQNMLSAAKLLLQESGYRANEHNRDRPGFFARLFRTSAAKIWKWRAKEIAREHRAIQETFRAAEGNAEAASAACMRAHSIVSEGKIDAERQALRVQEIEGTLSKWRSLLGNRFIDRRFFEMAHETRQAIIPWLEDSVQKLREDVFITALDVHKAFIGAAAQKILHNLSALFDLGKGAGTSDPAKLALLPELWSTLFLVVPVLSTTFASVDRMLGRLGPESIGWLLIDEAGQALPQAAVGAIMRSKRAMVVGDPIQIPPVVTLPQHLVDEISRFFKVNPPDWAAPIASAQTLADRASRYQSVFSGDAGERNVGLPLLVHRRCEEPMFGISNAIAYDGKMVTQVPRTDGGEIRRALGPSCWFDVEGDASTKWCPAEGEKVVELLKVLAADGIRKPDLFIVTPFRVVANEIRKVLLNQLRLFKDFGLDPDIWVNDHVGTVHTVQGREADTVILLLGAPKPTQNGARQWAGSPPNLANVAVSRAKRNLYVVGSRSAWQGAGCFSSLNSELPPRA
jgi:AAA domain